MNSEIRPDFPPRLHLRRAPAPPHLRATARPGPVPLHPREVRLAVRGRGVAAVRGGAAAAVGGRGEAGVLLGGRLRVRQSFSNL